MRQSISSATIRLASHYYSSQGQKLKVQPNKINMQKRKLKWGWNIDASTMLLKT